MTVSEKEINKKLKELLTLCKAKGILGTNQSIDNYYVMFSFEKLKPKCKHCGEILR